ARDRRIRQLPRDRALLPRRGDLARPRDGGRDARARRGERGVPQGGFRLRLAHRDRSLAARHHLEAQLPGLRARAPGPASPPRGAAGPPPQRPRGPEESEETPVNKRRVILPIVLVALAAGAWFWKDNHAAPKGELVLHGNVDIRHVELAFNANGRIAEVLAREGDRVAKGQALARLDTTRLALQVAQAEAQAASQRAQAAKLRAGSRPEEIRQAAAQR